MAMTMDGAQFSRMILSAAAAIELKKQKINELNVFPVPDGDTGTNMSMTLQAAAAELRKNELPSLSRAADVTASALLRGARGNSGVILSLLFRGFSKTFKGLEQAGGRAFASALTAGVEGAYKAVMKPAEGTILTVSRLSADCARDLSQSNDDLDFVLESTLATARAALDNTVNQNPVLKKAGVVDAGGMGFVAILEGMLESLRGHDTVCETAETASEQADFADFDGQDITYAFDTVFIIRRSSQMSLDAYRVYLDSIGDCVVIGEDEEAFKVHVHTNVPWDAVKEAQKFGELELCKIENMRLQHDALASGRKPRTADELEAEPVPVKCAEREKEYGFVTVCAGSGLAEVFRDLGADQIVEGGQTMNPSTEDILQAVEATPARTVFVLPNNKNIQMAASAAAELSQKKVMVIPSRTVPQGITAMLAFDESMPLEKITQTMTDALGTVTTMQLTYAARDSDFDGYEIREGDYLGLLEGGLLGTSRELSEQLGRMAELAADKGAAFINLFYGADIGEAEAEQAAELFRKACPDAEVNVLCGGQPIYYYLISAE